MSDDEIVHLNSVKTHLKLIYNITDGQQQWWRYTKCPSSNPSDRAKRCRWCIWHWGLLPFLDRLTFRGKLLKIDHSDKHETSQECWYQQLEEFLLNRFLYFSDEPEITRYLTLMARYIQGPMSQGVTAHDLVEFGCLLPYLVSFQLSTRKLETAEISRCLPCPPLLASKANWWNPSAAPFVITHVTWRILGMGCKAFGSLTVIPSFLLLEVLF